MYLCKTITREDTNSISCLQIQNHFNSAIYIYYRKPGVRDLVEVGIAHPNSIFHVPLQVVYNDPRYIFLNVDVSKDSPRHAA